MTTVFWKIFDRFWQQSFDSFLTDFDNSYSNFDISYWIVFDIFWQKLFESILTDFDNSYSIDFWHTFFDKNHLAVFWQILTTVMWQILTKVIWQLLDRFWQQILDCFWTDCDKSNLTPYDSRKEGSPPRFPGVWSLRISWAARRVALFRE